MTTTTTTTYCAKIERASGVQSWAIRDTYEEVMTYVNEQPNDSVKLYKMIDGKVFCQMKVKK